MNETLFSQIQRLFERTYAQVGINLEDCLIDRHRCRQLSILAGKSARELSELARTFLRTADDRLYVGIYYSQWLIDLFERQCPDAFNDRNLRARYLETTELASSYTHYLDTLNGMSRLDDIRRFRSLDYCDKKKHILALPAGEIFSRRVNLICEN